MKSSMKSSKNGSQNEMNSSNPVFFTDIASKPRAKTILTTLDSQKISSTTSEVSKKGENTSKMSKNVSSDDKMRGKASQDKSRVNSSKNPANEEEKCEKSPESPGNAPPQIKLLEVKYGTVEINWHKKFQRISFGRIKYQRSAHMPYALDPRRVKQLWRECAEEVLEKSPVGINFDDDDVVISKIILQKIKEDKILSRDKGTLDQDNCPKSPVILVDKGDNICTVDASTRDSVGEDVVSSTDCGEPGERCSPEGGIAEGEIDSSSSTPSNCSDDAPDSSLDPRTVNNILEIPQLLESLDSKTVKNILDIPEFLDSLKLKTVKNIAEIPEIPDSLEPKTVKNIAEIPQLPDSLEPKTVKNIAEIPQLSDSLDPKTVKNIAQIPQLPDSLDPQTVKNIAEIPEISHSSDPKTVKNTAEISELPDSLDPKTVKNTAEIPELADSLDSKTAKNIAEIPELPDSLDPKTTKNIVEIPQLLDSLEPKTVKNIAEIPELPDSLDSKTAKNILEIPELLDSLDPKTVKSILKIPELLDENRGSSHSHFIMRKDIKFNSSKGRQIKEPQETAYKEVSSEETSAKGGEEIVMGLNSSVEGKEDSPVQKENPKAVTSNPLQSSSNDNPVVESSISASPTSSHEKSSKIKSGEMSEVINKAKPSEKKESEKSGVINKAKPSEKGESEKSGVIIKSKPPEKEEKSSLLEKIKKRKEQSSDSSNVNGNEVSKSGKSSSKDRSSEPDAKKKKKSTPEEDLKESMKKKESPIIEKSHKDKESHKKHQSSSSSLTTASKKRESSGSRSSSQEPHRKKHRTSESSSHSGQSPEKVSSKVKSKDASLERTKTAEPSTPSAVNDSKEDVKKKPTPVGSCKKGRVSRLSLDGDSGTSVTSGPSVNEKIKETLDRVKVKNKPITESKKPTNSVNESALHRKALLELLGSPKESAEKKVERPPQKDKVEEKPETKNVEESKKESHDHPKIEKNGESMGKESAKQKAPEKSSAPSGPHVPGDYLGRRLLKIARDEKEKEKKILADVPKPASAVQRKKRASLPLIKTPAAQPAADILAINASVPIDVHLFENIDKEPLPPAPPVIPNNVFPHVLPDNPPEKTDRIPLICETSIPLNNLMDIDSLDQEDYDETCSLDSVETVKLEVSPKEPELKKSPVKEDQNDPNEVSSLREKISHFERDQSKFERIIRELQLIEASQIKEDTADQKPVNNNPDNNLVKLAAKDPQNFESKPLNQVVITAGPVRPEKKPQIHVPVKSQPIMPVILMQVMLPEPSNQLQQEEKEITMLYEDVIHLIQVTNHHRKKVDTMSVLEFQTHAASLCSTFKKYFDTLKNKENVITDEAMIQLIVEHSLHLPSPWHVKAMDISWLLRNSPMIPLAPVPPAIPKMNGKSHVHDKNMINNQLAAEQRQRHQHQQHHQLHVPKNEGPPTNAAANPPVNLQLPNNRGPHSDRVVPNQGFYPTNGHRPIAPRSMPNGNYQVPDQKREFPATQNEMMRMNVNMQQQQQQRPPLPDQPFPRAPPPPPPPPPPRQQQQQQQPALQAQNAYQQFNYNNQYQQFPQNEQMVPQQMPNMSPCAPNYPQQYGPYVGPLYCNQYQYIPGQSAPNMCNIQQFPPQQHNPAQLNQGSYQVPPAPLTQGSYQVPPAPLTQGSYQVPPLSRETVQNVNSIIPPELKLCFYGRCDHENCEKTSRFQAYLRQVTMDPTGGQLPPQTVPSQFAGVQGQSNRDPRSRGVQGSQMQMQMQLQVPQQHVAPSRVHQTHTTQSQMSQRQVPQPHVTPPQIPQSQLLPPRVSQPHIPQRQVLHQNVTPPQVPQSQVPSQRISQPNISVRQLLQQNATPPQVPQLQGPSPRISQPHIPQRQVSQQRATPPQLPQSQVPSRRVSQPNISVRQLLQKNVTPPQVPQSQVPSPRISQPHIPQSHIPQRQVLQQNVTPPQVPQSQGPLPRISQPHIPQQQVLQQNVTPSQGPSPQIPQLHISQRQVLQQNVTPPHQVPQSQVPSQRVSQPNVPQRQVLQQNVTPPQVPQSRVPSPQISQPQVSQPQIPQSQIRRQSPMQKSPANDAMMTTPRLQSNLAALQQMNQSIRPPHHIQNQGPLPKCPGRPNLQYPPRLPMPPMPHPASFGPLGNQTSNPQGRETFENTLNRQSPQTSMPHPPKIPTPTETCPKPIRSPVGKLLKEMLSTSTAPIPIAVLTPKNSPKPSASPNNTSQPPRNGSPLNLSTDKNPKTPEPPALHLNVKDESTERLINHKEVPKKRTIDVITVSSSEDEEESELEPEPKRPNMNPEFSRVDDEIECVGIAKELGIKLDSPASSELVNSEDSGNFPVIGTVMTIPMTDFEKMNIIMEKEDDQMDFKDEVPMEIQEEVPTEESDEEALCITCNKKTAVAFCRKCDKDLFCSETCADKSDHYASCIPVVKIDD